MFSNVKLKLKLFFIIFPLMLVLLSYAAALLHTYWREQSDANMAVTNMHLLQQAGAVVHELQKERGLTSGFLSSKGHVFVTELPAQRLVVDQKIVELKAFLDLNAQAINQSKFLTENLSEIRNNLTRLLEMRSQVNELKILAPDAIKFYTNTIAVLLKINISVIFENTNAALSTKIAAYSHFLQAKERAGIERALLSGVFAAKTITPEIYRQIIKIISEQNQSFALFNQLASKEQDAIYKNNSGDSVFTEIDNYRNDIYASYYDRDPKEWFSLATKRINFLKDMENQLGKNIIDDAQRAYEHAHSLFYAISVATFILTILCFLLAAMEASSITKKVATLTHIIHRIASEKTLQLKIPPLGRDEFGLIGIALNQLLDAFALAIKEIAHASKSITHSSQDSSVAIEQNAQMVDVQKREVLQTVSAVEEMSASINEVAHNVTLTSHAANEADKQVSHIAELIRHSDASVSGVAATLQKMATNVKELHDNSGQINEVINVIKSIADQTNLLALNAAIEAARAGEMGRGFAVVADEVRSLAHRTQQSTGEIESIISMFQNNAAMVYQDMTVSKENAEHSAVESDAVQKALQIVMTSVADIKDRSMQIATAAEEQAAVSNEISKSISRIGDSANEAVASSQILVKSANEQAALACELQEAAIEFTT